MIETVSLLFLTIVLFVGAVALNKRYPKVWTLPIFTVSAIMMAILVFFHIPYTDYQQATSIFNFLLGPAIVAFALPLYQMRKIVVKYLHFIVAGFTIGLMVSLLATYILGLLLPLDKALIHSLWEKNVTLPVAMNIASSTNGSVALTSIAVIISGCIGFSFGHKVMTWMKIDHFVARGVAMAAVAHVFGTNTSMALSKEEGGIALVTMVGTAILASVIIPILIS
ncbi:LrgB family protein [Macrococcoides canis]|uniref:Holin-like protein CidB n=1 Tax=Macrococcoides canis TaxID=1855823 RepID=A0A1W7A920_9STAP|nr:LrgB family protein [Macrococcus canis]ARQ06117.1 Inner membrane protein YohK [Macrococcus canis]UJS28176.1 LrgB family protein [Macrococcus canis]UTH11944.1 LrgB family protein [Macrococcus canis]WBF52532.1 LrgB family protein [Macrococcus canis]